ncbi:hypothetical protein [Fructobacillus parabroussonetiae]|uniref:Membrane protein 6-pyruvoyl-tetrahydropterin synthase-related domain-containing protein n=1 Tax=Fructobacillus parabroussonetiae TaxID=2713174 RepID=A0ABS5R0Q2_9LACO|nr:hypothetical protein [Fructobacillus parabroussonetiae]MBS9337737.1 hypothetical protein [Fructobacillus parabroussonetiae]
MINIKKKFKGRIQPIFEKKGLVDFILIIGLSIITVLPAFMGHYYNSSSDGFNHLDRFENIYEAFKSGHLPSLFNFQYAPSNSAPGAAVNGLYPWLPGLIFIIPRLIFSTPLQALAVGFLILNAITMFNARLLMSKLTSNRWLLWLGIILYQFNNFHLIDLFSRSDFGESFAYAWLPLIFVGLMEIHDDKKSGVWLLGLGMGMMANSHVLTLLMSFVFILVFEVIRFLTKKLTLDNFKKLIYAGIIAIFVGFYSLFNIVLIYLRAKIDEPAHYLMDVDPMTFLTSFIQNNMGEKGYWSYGLPLLIVQITLTVLIFKYWNKQQWFGWIIAADILTIGIFNWWPWFKFINTPLSLIQFLQRANLFIVMFLCIGIVLYFNKKNSLNNFKIILLELAVCLFSLAGAYSVHATYFGPDKYHDAITNANYTKMLTTRYSFGEFLPISKDTGKVELKQSKNKSVSVKEIGRKSDSIVYNVKTTKDQFVSFRTVMYDDFKYDIKLDGKKVQSKSINQVKILVPEGTHKVSVQAESSRNAWQFTVTIITIMLAIFMIAKTYRPNVEED